MKKLIQKVGYDKIKEIENLACVAITIDDFSLEERSIFAFNLECMYEDILTVDDIEKIFEYALKNNGNPTL